MMRKSEFVLALMCDVTDSVDGWWLVLKMVLRDKNIQVQINVASWCCDVGLCFGRYF